MMEQNEEEQATETYLPVRPDKRRRVGIMFSQLLPGLLLLLSVSGNWPSNSSSFALFAFSLIAGLSLVFVSIRSFRHVRKPSATGANLVVVFTGFVLIAQGTNTFSAVRGFQPAHLLLLSGFLYVFRGVMFPGERNRQGFHITANDITYRRSAFVKSGPVPREGIVSASLNGNELNLVYAGGESRVLKLSGSEHPAESARDLGEFLGI